MVAQANSVDLAAPLDLTDYAGISLEVRSKEYMQYGFGLYENSSDDPMIWQNQFEIIEPVEGQENDWMTVQMPFANFKSQRRGQLMYSGQMDLTKIKNFYLSYSNFEYFIGDQVHKNSSFKEGDFELQFRNMKAYGRESKDFRDEIQKTSILSKLENNKIISEETAIEPGKLTYIIQASSSSLKGNSSTSCISINDFPVEMQENRNGDYRGLHLVIINPNNGKVETAKVFDTYESSEDFDEFCQNSGIPDGHIVVAACKEECVINLSEQAMDWFEDLGSTAMRKVA